LDHGLGETAVRVTNEAIQEFYIYLRQLRKHYGNVQAVREVTLGIRRGEFFSLLGPSGCGKTTTLRMIAGFVRPSSGQILVRGRLLNEIPAYKRDMSMVFQNYALFPHLNVFANIAFGLRMRGTPKAEISRRVHDAMELVRLRGLAKAYPRQLSGGQQQRVALARALVLNPLVLLLDEPLSNLDAKLRQEMRVEIREMVKRLEMTTLYVTHDQEEALAMSDRIGVMRGGQVEQVGSPLEIYDHPNTMFVASFIGSSNIFSGRVRGSEGAFVVIETDQHLLIRASRTGSPSLQRVAVVLRPERILVTPETSDLPNRFRGKVRTRVFVGETTHYILELDSGATIRVHRQTRAEESIAEGTSVEVGWRPEDVCTIPIDDMSTGEGLSALRVNPPAPAVEASGE
jgi:spermidine/putrescine ABC transporter ATP-binding subunit